MKKYRKNVYLREDNVQKLQDLSKKFGKSMSSVLNDLIANSSDKSYIQIQEIQDKIREVLSPYIAG